MKRIESARKRLNKQLECENKLADGERMIEPHRLYIVNEVDRPDKPHIAYRVTPRRLRYIEINWPPMALTDRATPLADFGFSFQETPMGLLCTIVTESRAKYPDGKTREWQGEYVFILLNRKVEELLK